MDVQSAIDLGRQAIVMMLLVSSPILVGGLLVGLIIGLFQALTQIQEQTVAFVPKLVAMVLILSLTLPWLISQMIEYTQQLFAGIPQSL